MSDLTEEIRIEAEMGAESETFAHECCQRILELLDEMEGDNE